ncbi:ZPR1 zinc finger domain-containing protein [Candidatus Woesearchaeota archaeon]|nr:ZPR1 zinc finger domain-containing protein [Candidatus Woesearchaeota archaeon]
MSVEDFNSEVLEGEHCPFCNKKTLTLRQAEREVPFFGNLIIFSMDCENEDCGYHKADVEASESKGPVKASFEVTCEEDLKVRVVKSSSATIKIAHVGSIEPGEASNGYVTNIEGILNRMKVQVEKIRDNTDDDSEKKKAKNIIKKLTKVMMGSEKIKITLDDPTGNSAIISEKTEFKNGK